MLPSDHGMDCPAEVTVPCCRVLPLLITPCPRKAQFHRTGRTLDACACLDWDSVANGRDQGTKGPATSASRSSFPVVPGTHEDRTAVQASGNSPAGANGRRAGLWKWPDFWPSSPDYDEAVGFPKRGAVIPLDSSDGQSPEADQLACIGRAFLFMRDDCRVACIAWGST